jgi:hypothetical protein
VEIILGQARRRWREDEKRALVAETFARSGGRPTVEDSLSLNLPRLFKTGWLKQGAWTSGTLRWSIVGTGEEIASIGFEARLGEKDGYAHAFICLLGPTRSLVAKPIDWPIDHSAKRSVIAPDPAHSHYAESSATMAGSVITLQSPRACTGALSNAP